MDIKEYDKIVLKKNKDFEDLFLNNQNPFQIDELSDSDKDSFLNNVSLAINKWDSISVSVHLPLCPRLV